MKLMALFLTFWLQPNLTSFHTYIYYLIISFYVPINAFIPVECFFITVFYLIIINILNGLGYSLRVSRLNQVWLAGITYIRIRTGFVYLAAVLDACSRRVIGYAISTRLDTALTLQALRMAIAERQPVAGIIHHSDQGVQYASTEYVAELRSYGFDISMARTGNPYENAVMESFFKTLKQEEVYLYEFETIEDVIARLPYFIE